MHIDMTAITMQSNKSVSNEVKSQLSTTRAILWRKQNKLFGQPSITQNLYNIPNEVLTPGYGFRK